MAKIRQEINILDTIITTTSNHGKQYVLLDTTKYSGTVSYYFEIVANIPSGEGFVTLRVIDDSANAVQISVSGASYTRYRSSFTPPDGQTQYKAFMASSMNVKSARIIIIQDTGSDPLTSTETQIEIGAQQTGNVNTTAAPLTNPKYWYYDSAVWDGTCVFYAECTNFQTGSGVITIKLQEDNGSFASWADKVTIVNAATPASITRTRSASFTPTSGRNYRIVGSVASNMDTWEIYNAKIIVQQIPTGDTYYFDGSDAAASDPGGVWTGDANAFDGNTATDAFTTTAGSTSSNFLKAEGTNAPSSGNTISSVKARTYATASPVAIGTTIYTDGLAETLGTSTYLFQEAGWSPYFDLTTPSGGWTWAKVQALEVKLYKYTTQNPFVSKIEVMVIDTTDSITKLEPQYLLANAAVGAGTGLQDFDSYYDPAEWSGVTNVYYHEGNNVASGTSDIKLQSDPNGTPADVTSSTITDVIERERSSAMTMPVSAQTIDVNQTGV